jgi:hypothetical protein
MVKIKEKGIQENNYATQVCGGNKERQQRHPDKKN